MLTGLFEPFVLGLATTVGIGLAIGLTRRWHGAFSYDHTSGPQKLHSTPTPRIGGLAVYAGFWLAAVAAPPPVRDLLFAVAASAVFALAAGTVEDVSKRGGLVLRFFAPMLSGAVFCLVTGYAVTRVEIPFVDRLMVFPSAIALTAFAMAGFTHAMNIIDGVHGLATGTTIIMLIALAVVSLRVGDHEMALFGFVSVGVFLGFLLVNFPFGSVFLGDGGAYFAGFVVASAAIMVPMRNPDISPWVSVVILAYPLLETGFAVVRKIRKGRKPWHPDRMHLHMIVYRRLRRILSGRIAREPLANPATGMLLWGGSAASLIAVALVPLEREWCLGILVLLFLLYDRTYRTVARMRPAYPTRPTKTERASAAPTTDCSDRTERPPK